MQPQQFSQKSQNQTFSHINNWVLNPSLHSQTLKCQNNKVIVKKPTDIFGTNILGNIFTFKLIIDKLPKEIGFGIGIADISYSKISKFNHLHNWICYYRGGEFEIGNDMISEQNMKFQQGDIVQIRGNKNTMIISWLINNKIAINYQWDTLKNKQINWVISIFSQTGNIEMRMIQKWQNIDILPIFLAEQQYLWDYDILYLLNTIINFIQNQQNQ